MATSQDPLHVALLEPFLPPPLKVEEHARIFQRAYDALSDTYQDDPKVHTAKRIALVDRSTFVILEAIHLKYVPTPDMREKLVSLILKFIAPAEAEVTVPIVADRVGPAPVQKRKVTNAGGVYH